MKNFIAIFDSAKIHEIPDKSGVYICIAIPNKPQDCIYIEPNVLSAVILSTSMVARFVLHTPLINTLI